MRMRNCGLKVETVDLNPCNDVFYDVTSHKQCSVDMMLMLIKEEHLPFSPNPCRAWQSEDSGAYRSTCTQSRVAQLGPKSVLRVHFLKSKVYAQKILFTHTHTHTHTEVKVYAIKLKVYARENS